MLMRRERRRRGRRPAFEGRRRTKRIFGEARRAEFRPLFEAALSEFLGVARRLPGEDDGRQDPRRLASERACLHQSSFFTAFESGSAIPRGSIRAGRNRKQIERLVDRGASRPPTPSPRCRPAGDRHRLTRLGDLVDQPVEILSRLGGGDGLHANNRRYSVRFVEVLVDLAGPRTGEKWDCPVLAALRQASSVARAGRLHLPHRPRQPQAGSLGSPCRAAAAAGVPVARANPRSAGRARWPGEESRIGLGQTQSAARYCRAGSSDSMCRRADWPRPHAYTAPAPDYSPFPRPSRKLIRKQLFGAGGEDFEGRRALCAADDLTKRQAVGRGVDIGSGFVGELEEGGRWLAPLWA